MDLGTARARQQDHHKIRLEIAALSFIGLIQHRFEFLNKKIRKTVLIALFHNCKVLGRNDLNYADRSVHANNCNMNPELHCITLENLGDKKKNRKVDLQRFGDLCIHSTMMIIVHN